jgi:hypothetical protein
LVHNPNRTDETGDNSTDAPPANDPPDNSDSYSDSGLYQLSHDATAVQALSNNVVESAANLFERTVHIPALHRRLGRLRRSHSIPQRLFPNYVDSISEAPEVSIAGIVPISSPLPVPTERPVSIFPGQVDGTQTTDGGLNSTPAPAFAPARTQKGGKSCTPSPTSMAPSASMCPSIPLTSGANYSCESLDNMSLRRSRRSSQP